MADINITIQPSSSTIVQTAANVSALPKSGGTMTGPLNLSSDPTSALQAATKQYVDNGDSLGLKKSGDTMTGLLNLSSDPTSALQAATKRYVDGKVSDLTSTANDSFVKKSGDTMTGPLNLSSDPTSALQAATKQYVDNKASAALPVRQTILSGPVDANGSPSLLPPTSSSLSITSQQVTTSVPIIVAASCGFGQSGAMDRIGKSVSNLIWNSLTANSTNYLYIDISQEGALTTGVTTIQPTYGNTLIFTRGSNIASYVNAICSSTISSWPLSGAFDGNSSTAWAANDGNGSSGIGVSYIGQDFGSGNAYQIIYATLSQGTGSDTNGSCSSCKVQYSDNGTIWTDAVTLIMPIDNNIVHGYDIPPCGAHRFWRFSQNASTYYGWAIRELTMFPSIATPFMFSIPKMIAYASSDGVATTPMYRVFVGEAVTSASAVTSTVTYAYQGSYDSGWTNSLPASATKTTRSHNIGVKPLNVDFVLENITTEANWTVGQQLSARRGLYTAASVNYPLPLGADEKTLFCTTSTTSAFLALNTTTGAQAVLTAANWKYKFIASRGW